MISIFLQFFLCLWSLDNRCVIGRAKWKVPKPPLVPKSWQAPDSSLCTKTSIHAQQMRETKSYIVTSINPWENHIPKGSCWSWRAQVFIKSSFQGDLPDMRLISFINGALVESRPTKKHYLRRVLTVIKWSATEWSVVACNCQDANFQRRWQYNKSHIGEVTLKGRLYKDLGSLIPTHSFWGVVLPTVSFWPIQLSFLFLFLFFGFKKLLIPIYKDLTCLLLEIQLRIIIF